MERCKISTLDHKVLAGGFLHIQESLKDKRVANEWADRGLPYLAKPEKSKIDRAYATLGLWNLWETGPPILPGR